MGMRPCSLVWQWLKANGTKMAPLANGAKLQPFLRTYLSLFGPWFNTNGTILGRRTTHFSL